MDGWTEYGVGKKSVGLFGEVEVRWGLVEDEAGLSELLQLNGMPCSLAFEERFIVAEVDGRLLAALQYRTYSKRLLLGRLVVDPWAEEPALAVALYAGAGELARDIGVADVLARPVYRANYPYEAGYRRRGRGWRLNTARPLESSGELPANGWRRVVALLGVLAVPFHKESRE